MSENSFKNNFIWNIIGTMFNSFNSMFFMILVTRINGVNDAGVFTIAFSTACIFYVVGLYAGRVFQVSSNKETTDKDFVVNRIISCIAMILFLFIFVIFRGYDFSKAILFIVLGIYKALEAFSDVVYGILQKSDRLDLVGKSYFIKSLLSIIIFLIINLITHNMIFASVAMCIIWFIIILLYDLKYCKKYIEHREYSISNSMLIFKNGFFIFAISFLNIYILNAPKYSIDSMLSNYYQTIFGIIVMPATVMALISQFFLHPYLNRIIDMYQKKKIKELKLLILKISGLLLGIGVVASLGAYIIGAEVLSIVYGVSLVNYKIALVLIIIGATFYNIGTIFSTVLTTMRKTFSQFIIYIMVSIIALIITSYFTRIMGINGAVYSYFIIMLSFFVIYLILLEVIFKLEVKK